MTNVLQNFGFEIAIASLGMFFVMLSCIFEGNFFPQLKNKSNNVFTALVVLSCIAIVSIICCSSFNGSESILFFTKSQSYLIIARYVVLFFCIFSLFIIFARVNSFLYYSLALFSLCGSLLLLSASGFLSFYMALELQSIPIFIIIAQKKTIKSSFGFEGMLKYFVISSLLSCLFIYGASLMYANFGSLDFNAIESKVSLIISSKANATTLQSGVLHSDIAYYGKTAILGFVFILFALFGKLSLAPFHFWSPDLYQKLTKSSLFFVVSIPKIAVLFTISPLVSFALAIFTPQDFAIISKIMLIMIIISMIVGSFGGLKQTNIKRLLAYSGILNAAFMIAPSLVSGVGGLSLSLFYIVIYVLNVLVILACVALLKHKYSTKFKSMNDIAMIYKNDPLISFCMSVAVISAIGIPPFAGFFTKFFILQYIFNFSIVLFSVALLSSVVASFYYLSILKSIYFVQPQVSETNNDTKNQQLTTTRKLNKTISPIFLQLFCGLVTIVNFAISFKPLQFVEIFFGKF